MSKKFYLLLPVTKEKIVITVDDGDAYRLRSEAWRIKKNRKGIIEVYKQKHGVSIGFGRELLGIKQDGGSATHKIVDPTDFRRSNLVLMDRKTFIKQIALPALEAGRGWHSDRCKRGHLLTAENIIQNGKCGRICGICRREGRRATLQAKRWRYRDQVRESRIKAA